MSTLFFGPTPNPPKRAKTTSEEGEPKPWADTPPPPEESPEDPGTPEDAYDGDTTPQTNKHRIPPPDNQKPPDAPKADKTRRGLFPATKKGGGHTSHTKDHKRHPDAGGSGGSGHGSVAA